MSRRTTTLSEKINQKRKKIAELVEKKGQLLQEIDTAEDSAAELEAFSELTEEQQKRLTDLSEAITTGYTEVKELNQTLDEETVAIEQLKQQLEVRQEQQRHEETLQSSAGTGGAGTGGTGSGQKPVQGTGLAAPLQVVQAPVTEQELRNDLADMVRVLTLSAQNRISHHEQCDRLPNELGEMTRENSRIKPMFEAATTTNNANVIPPNYVPVLIDLLRPFSIIRSLPGLQTPPMVDGKYDKPVQTGGTTANYKAEMANIVPSDISTGPFTLLAKELTALTVMSNQFMRRANPQANSMILNDLAKAVGEKEDVTFIRNTANLTTNPQGLLNIAPVANKISANATINVQNVDRDLQLMVLALVGVNLTLRMPAWLMAHRSLLWLQSLRDGNGNLVFPETVNNMLKGFPVMVSTQIPTNLGGGTNESEIYFVESTELVLAETGVFEMASSMEAAYHDGSAVQAAFSQNATVTKLSTEHDFGAEHDVAVAVLQNVLWGA